MMLPIYILLIYQHNKIKSTYELFKNDINMNINISLQHFALYGLTFQIHITWEIKSQLPTSRLETFIIRNKTTLCVKCLKTRFYKRIKTMKVQPGAFVCMQSNKDENSFLNVKTVALYFITFISFAIYFVTVQ